MVGSSPCPEGCWFGGVGIVTQIFLFEHPESPNLNPEIHRHVESQVRVTFRSGTLKLCDLELFFPLHILPMVPKRHCSVPIPLPALSVD